MSVCECECECVRECIPPDADGARLAGPVQLSERLPLSAIGRARLRTAPTDVSSCLNPVQLLFTRRFFVFINHQYSKHIVLYLISALAYMYR